MAIPTLNLTGKAAQLYQNSLQDPNQDPNQSLAIAQEIQKQQDASAAKMAALNAQGDAAKADAERYGKSAFGIPSLGYTLLDKDSGANLTKLAPLAAGAVLAPLTGGLSLGAASAITGAATGVSELAREGLNNETISPGDALKEGLKSGVGNYVGGKIIGAGLDKILGKATGEGANAIESAGDSLRKGVLNPSVKVDPFMAENEQALQEVASKYGLKGSSENQISQLPDVFRNIQGKIQGLLKDSDYTVPTDKFMTEIKQAVIDHGDTNFSPEGEAGSTMTNNAFKKSMNLLFKGKGDTLSAQDLYDMKQAASAQNSFGKANPTEADMVKQAFYDHMKEALNNVSDEIGGLNKDQNAIYDISKGLAKSEKTPIKLPFVGVGVPGNAVQAAKDLAGRALQAGGGAINKGVQTVANGIPSALPSILQNQGVLSAINSGTQSVVSPSGSAQPTNSQATLDLQEQTKLPADNGNTGAWIPGQSMSRQQYQDLISKDLGTTGGRFIPQITATFQAQNPDNLQALNNAVGSYKALEKSINETGSGSGRIAGNIQSALGKIGLNSTANSYNQNSDALMTELAKQFIASGGSEADVAAMMKSKPEESDTKQEVATKLATIRSLLAQRVNSNQNSTSSSVMSSLNSPSLNLNR